MRRSVPRSSAAPSKSRCARSSATPAKRAPWWSARSTSTPDPHYGYNAATNQYEDLVAAGVIDPTKVTRTALQNAASIAGLMLTTEAMVADIPEPKQAAPAGHGGGMDGMY